MLFIKDFRTTATSYNLILEDSETHELSEAIYDFNDDEFGGVENFAALKMLNDINTGKYRLTLSINANNRTAALLSFIKEYKYDKNALIYLLRLYRAKNAGSSEFAKEYYGYYYGKNGEKIYIADYATTGGKSSIITINEKSDKIDDAIVKHHRNLIRKTGELNGTKLRKFNRVQFLAMMILARKSKTDVFKL